MGWGWGSTEISKTTEAFLSMCNCFFLYWPSAHMGFYTPADWLKLKNQRILVYTHIWSWIIGGPEFYKTVPLLFCEWKLHNLIIYYLTIMYSTVGFEEPHKTEIKNADFDKPFSVWLSFFDFFVRCKDDLFSRQLPNNKAYKGCVIGSQK
jgi:hypothetical protein